MQLFVIKYAHEYAQQSWQLFNYFLKYARKYAFIFLIIITLILIHKYNF